MVKVKEIFTSIQGEGPYLGYKQIFVRLCGCNLHCAYCDTDFNDNNYTEYSVSDIVELCNQNSDCHSISITGGEPLLYPEFIRDLGEKLELPVYLETNGTLYKNLEKVIDYVTYIAADIKLPSATGLPPMWEEHEEFIKIAVQKGLFIKVVFDEKITDFEIHKISHLCAQYGTELILQPMMNNGEASVTSDFMCAILDKCLKIYKKTRLIPQVHKYINVE